MRIYNLTSDDLKKRCTMDAATVRLQIGGRNTMKNKNKKILDNYLTDINKLFKKIDKWLAPSGLVISRTKIEITEEASGKYSIDKLIITGSDDNTIASVVPVGAWVIGANGRIDMIGRYDRIILLKLEGNTQENETTSRTSVEKVNHTSTLFKSINTTDWYWIENRRLGRAYLLNKQLFYELLTEVSDYEFK